MIDNNLRPHTAMPLSLLETVFGLAMWLSCNPIKIMFFFRRTSYVGFGRTEEGLWNFTSDFVNLIDGIYS